MAYVRTGERRVSTRNDPILEFLKEIDCDQKQIDRYVINKEKIGAIWHQNMISTHAYS